MTAYAAIVSLMNNIQQYHNHPRLSTTFDQNQIQSLCQKVNFFLDFIERDDSHGGCRQVEDLEAQIAFAVHAAEDVIESRIVDQIRPGSTGIDGSNLKCFEDLQRIMTVMDSIKENAIKVEEERRFVNDEKPTNSIPAVASSTPIMAVKTTLVGFDDYSLTLLDKLTGGSRDRQIIPIVGMAGIGKTTLARNVYERLVKDPQFDVHAWVTVSPQYNVRQILVKILKEIHTCLRKSPGEMDLKTEAQLGVELHQILFRRRYLIVLDDIWSADDLENIQHLLPHNYDGNRIVVTSRIASVARNFGSFAIVMKSLNDEQSWDLFCQKAFGQGVCPRELQERGKRIVEKCEGVPLSIVMIGGLIGKSSGMAKDWEYLEENVNFIVNSDGVISLSYNYLPACLKPCFLYLGIFPEDHEICVSQLIKLWVSEGFIKPSQLQSMEDTAKGYIKDLVDRNLILVCGFGSNGNFKTCKIHDLLRDFCVREVEKQKFLCVMRVFDTTRDINRERRIIIHGSAAVKYYCPEAFNDSELTSLARSLICQSPTLLPKSRLLRVLSEAYGDSLDDTFCQVNLRFLAYGFICAPVGWMYTYKLPLSISQLWNVQTLMIDKSIDAVVAPSEIWNMPQLRHLHFRKILLPDPPPCSHKQDDIILTNLQTLGTVLDFKCSEEVCRRMPNIRKLQIFYDDFSEKGEASSWYGIDNVCHFERLESLYYCFNAVPDRDDLLERLSFPRWLKRLALEYCELYWGDLTIIGKLPHLEVLKLKPKSVRGSKWDTVEEEFQSLKFLEIDSCYLIYWNAESSHFPVLEKLLLRKLHKLEEIPFGIGDISTLTGICVTECTISVAISAVQILEEQESQDIQVQIQFCDEIDLQVFQERVRLLGFTTKNFQTQLL